MNEAQTPNFNLDTDQSVTSTCQPRWWGFDPAREDVTPVAAANAFAALAPRLAAIGDLVAATGEAALRDDTRRWLGEVILDYADEADALALAIDSRCRSGSRKAAPTPAATPDPLDGLREAAERAGHREGHAKGFALLQVRTLYARVIGEIDAGERDEEDRDEADALLLQALAATGSAEDGEAAA